MPGADSSQEMPTCFYTTTAPIRLCYDQTLTGNVSFLLVHVSFKTLSLCDPQQKEGPQSPHRGNPAAPPQGSRSGHPRANASPPLPYTKLGASAGILSKLLTTSESTEAQKGLGATVFLRPQARALGHSVHVLPQKALSLIICAQQHSEDAEMGSRECSPGP